MIGMKDGEWVDMVMLLDDGIMCCVDGFCFVVYDILCGCLVVYYFEINLLVLLFFVVD